MNHSHEDRFPADLQSVVELLKEQRPEASPLELDRIKLRAKTRGARTQPSFVTRQKGLTMMRSRIAVTSMLTLGVFMSGTGATLATDAALEQYKSPPEVVVTKGGDVTPPKPTVVTPPAATTQATPPSTTVTPQPQVLGDTDVKEQAQPPAEDAPSTPAPESDAAPEATPQSDVAPAASPAQPARQVAADSGDQLPFTGFAAIPVLLGGIALTGSGLVLRRKGNKLDQ